MADSSEHDALLRQTWAPARGFPGVLAEVNNQILGVRIMVTAFVFFLLGGGMAVLMRLQLAVSDNTLLGPQVYNELFTMHGSTMMFLFAVPFLEGLALYLVPMMIGARDVAFPRLTAYGFWVYLMGGCIFYASYVVGAVPDIGWFGYTPLSTARFTGMATDFWLLGLSLVEVAGLTAALELVATIFKFRAPGMTLGRMPLSVWAVLVMSMMILFAFSVLLTATVLLELDRTANTRFFDIDRGGNNLLWQHLFWFFGHPEVYIMFLPASGIVSMIVPVFARRKIVAYVWIVVAMVLTGFVSFGLWVHHMFAAGLPHLSMAFFTASSLMIAIASGIQVFAWIATLWESRPQMQAPLLFALGFLFLFVLGGLTGVMVAVVPFDLQVHDTYFIVAHFHYVLIGGVIFPLFAGLYYWMPKFSGRLLNPRLGKLSFWLQFVGFNVTFFPMHIMGFLGLPRRVYTYPESLGLDGYNLLATAGAVTMGLGVLVFLIDFFRGLGRGMPAGANPWDADSLEWSVASPPPVYTFFQPPVIRGDQPHGAETESAHDAPQHVGETPASRDLVSLQEKLAGEPQTWRGTLVTDVHDARPQAIQLLPGPTFVPLWAALGTALVAIGALSRAYILGAFGCIVVVATVGLWTRSQRVWVEQLNKSYLPEQTGLPVSPCGTLAATWWGVLGMLTIWGSAFGALFYTYFYLRLFSPEWPQGGISPPDLWLPAAGFAALIASGGAAMLALRGWRQENRPLTGGALGASLLLGLMFVVWQGIEWRGLDFSPQANAYGSVFYVLGWALTLTVAIGLGMNVTAQVRYYRAAKFDPAGVTRRLEVASLYGGFTAVVAMLVFATLYVAPNLR